LSVKNTIKGYSIFLVLVYPRKM